MKKITTRKQKRKQKKIKNMDVDEALIYHLYGNFDYGMYRQSTVTSFKRLLNLVGWSTENLSKISIRELPLKFTDKIVKFNIIGEFAGFDENPNDEIKRYHSDPKNIIFDCLKEINKDNTTIETNIFLKQIQINHVMRPEIFKKMRDEITND